MLNAKAKLLTMLKAGKAVTCPDCSSTQTEFKCRSCGYCFDFATNAKRDLKTGLAHPASASVTRYAWLIGKLLRDGYFAATQYHDRFPDRSPRSRLRDVYVLKEAGFIIEYKKSSERYFFVTFREYPEAA